MNKIKVNMAVEPNDIQTLHCSQYDTEERKFSVDLHENGVGVSPSSISNQLVYKSFKGGTEQILPTNTSTPSTSPIIADIQYKDGLREDEEFLYRESPSDVDGYAKIEEIRGNTLVWNQLVQNGNFESTTGWKAANTNYGTITASGNILTYTVANQQANPYNYRVQQQNDDNLGIPVGHKVLVAIDFNPSEANNGSVQLQSSVGALDKTAISFTGVEANKWTHLSTIYTIQSASQYIAFYLKLENPQTVGATFKFRNFIIIDLTKMFGSGNEPTLDQFTKLFPLPYYSYDSGSLLSFNGTGIKSVGKNLFNNDTDAIENLTFENNLYATVTRWGYKLRLPAGEYVASATRHEGGNNAYLYIFTNSLDGKYVGGSYNVVQGATEYDRKFTLNQESYVYFINAGGDGKTRSQELFSMYDLQIEFGSTSTDYVPYSTNTLSLPISTYFPDGMMSAGTVRDEMTADSYTKRVGMVDLGNLTYNYSATRYWFSYANVSTLLNMKLPTNNQSKINGVSAIYSMNTRDTLFDNTTIDMQIAVNQSTDTLLIRNLSYTSTSDFKTAMSGVYLIYELSTPLVNYGVVDLGSLEWTYDSGNARFKSTVIDGIKAPSSASVVANAICKEYPCLNYNSSVSTDKSFTIIYEGSGAVGQMWVHDSSYTSKESFTTAMSGKYLLYELVEPKGLTTASIVTNYGEMPLYEDNGELKADCIADVSQNSGFQIAKVKLKDENGEIYSNPFQIHTERSPQ